MRKNRILFYLSAVLMLNLCSVQGQDYKPSAEFSSLMNLRFYEGSGGFYVDHLQLLFSPQSKQKYYFVILNESGKVLQSVPLTVEKWPQFPMFDGLRILGNPTVPVGKPGKYNFVVTAGKTPLTVMPFGLEVIKNNDPFNPQQTFVRTGLWAVLAFLSREINKPDAPLHFNWWSTLREFANPSGSAVTCRAEIWKDNQLFAELAAGVTVSSVNWQFFNRGLRLPKSKGKKNLRLSMLTDGAYRIVVKSGANTIKAYQLLVRNGQIQPLPFNDLHYEPHTNFISPRFIDISSGSSYKMLDAFWVKKEK